jgi:hypothetical protein
VTRVRIGARYRYEPVAFDALNPPFGAEPGDIVTIVRLPGCPKPGTMGMVHIARNGRFAGMVMIASLHPAGKG